MRRKLGILLLAGITTLAGTQEAMRQFDGLRSSVNELTRASLWSGLIVYAQPVADGKLPAPQIYYLTPQPQTSRAPQEALLVDNNNPDAAPTAAAKPETKNNHVAEEVAEELAAANMEELLPPSPPPALVTEDAAKSELVLVKTAEPVKVAPRVVVVPKIMRARVFEEVARNEANTRRFKQEADAVVKALTNDLDAAKLEAELTRLAATQEQLETSKLKAFVDAENSVRRLELRVLRRPAARPERLERIKVIAPSAAKRVVALPEISSIGCEKTTNESGSPIAVEKKVETTVETSVENIVAVAVMATRVKIASEPTVAVEMGLPAVFAAPFPASTSWALGCDTEPEYK